MGEAAWAAARNSGLHVGSAHWSRETVAQMPCNPAIGERPGHIVREIDAPGGLMGRAIDRHGSSVQVAGTEAVVPVVWCRGRRPTSARIAGGAWVRRARGAPEHRVDSWTAGRLEISGGRISGLHLEDGDFLSASAVVITTGTFLNGLIHIGPEQRPAGRLR